MKFSKSLFLILAVTVFNAILSVAAGDLFETCIHGDYQLIGTELSAACVNDDVDAVIDSSTDLDSCIGNQNGALVVCNLLSTKATLALEMLSNISVPDQWYI